LPAASSAPKLAGQGNPLLANADVAGNHRECKLKISVHPATRAKLVKKEQY
jgi:hypothetical protein